MTGYPCTIHPNNGPQDRTTQGRCRHCYRASQRKHQAKLRADLRRLRAAEAILLSA
jgi:hypothetical protein